MLLYCPSVLPSKPSENRRYSFSANSPAGASPHSYLPVSPFHTGTMRPPVTLTVGVLTTEALGWMVTSLMRSVCVVKLAKSLGERRSNLRSMSETGVPSGSLGSK